MSSVPAAAHAPAFFSFPFSDLRERLSRSLIGESPMKGVLLIVIATVFFTCSDMSAKYLTQDLPAIEIAWIRYVVFCAIVIPLALMKGGRQVLSTRRPGQQIMRGLCMVLSTILFLFGLGHLSVADATAINFVSPVFITALAIPLLGETVGLRRWVAAAIGLVGVLIIVQPGSSAFQLAALFPVAAAATWALAAIATRIMSATESPQTTLVYSAGTGLVVLTAAVFFEWTTPTWGQLGVGVLVGLFSTIAHWLFILSYRHATASMLAPFSYIQIIWASGLGFLIFGAIPSVGTYIGAAVIAASGLYTAHRERVRGRLEAEARAEAAAR